MIRRIAMLVGAVMALVSLVAVTPAGAALLPANEFCAGAGRLVVSDFGLPGPTTWQMRGSGFCGRANFPVRGLETVTLAGSGTSNNQGLGVIGIGDVALCTDTVVVTNFVMAVHADFAPVAANPAPHSTNEVWSAPITVFPVITPLLVSRSDRPTSPAGASVLISHIFLQCGNDGDQPSVQFDWAQLF